MNFEIRELKRKDERAAMQFAITGMHFNWYVDSKVILKLYGRYFWYLERTRATQVIAAYCGDRLAGVLLAEMKGDQRQRRSLWQSFYLKCFDLLQRLFSEKGAGLYEKTTRELLDGYLVENSPDGEIVFLAANPEFKGKGVVSYLLTEFERREPGKTVFLHTDDACTYQFYDHRGFDCVGEKQIVMEIMGKQVPLKCLLYSKRIGP
jgi:hypothetical protein